MKILITGKNSYIGKSFKKFADQRKLECEIDCFSLRDGTWSRKLDFSAYDTVLHVAGLAHADVGNVTEEVKQEYYKVNRDLTYAVAEHAKQAGVQQFIYLSSMIIYGDSASYGKHKIINSQSKPEPSNFYGDSKWQADRLVSDMGGQDFSVAVVRPPMIYGQGSKGNYPILSKMAKKLPLFPNIKNQRSMLYIENLCEFLCQLIENRDQGIYFPQNAKYVSTVELVKEIAEVSGHKIIATSLLNPFVRIASKMPGKIGRIINKAFGNFVYDLTLSQYRDNTYQKFNLKASVERTEQRDER